MAKALTNTPSAFRKLKAQALNSIHKENIRGKVKVFSNTLLKNLPSPRVGHQGNLPRGRDSRTKRPGTRKT